METLSEYIEYWKGVASGLELEPKERSSCGCRNNDQAQRESVHKEQQMCCCGRKGCYEECN